MSDVRLQYLFEAARTGSMRAASERLGVAVSSISRQIAQLESELGQSLIEHGRRTVRLTEAGEIAVTFFRERQDHNESFLTKLRDLKGMRSGRVTLAVGEGFVGTALSRVVAGFMTKFPGLTVAVSVAASNEVINMISEDEADLGLVFNVPPIEKVRARVTLAQPIRLLAAPTHPLALRSSVMLADLAPHKLCLPEKSFRINQLISLAQARESVLLAPDLTSNSIGMLKDLVQTGEFITLLPEIGAVSEIAERKLVSVPVDSTLLRETTIALIGRVGRQLPAAAARLGTQLEICLRSWTELAIAERANPLLANAV